jgi:hypothetical protein
MVKLLFTILFLFSIAAHATTYYVSSSTGSNTNSGTRNSPFQTNGKALSVVVPFDSIRLLAGDFWIEQIIVPVANITFDSFGTGNLPLVTGFQTVTGFTQSGSVWTKTLTTAPGNLRCVLLNGKLAIKARTPNAGYLAFSSWSGDSSITTSETGTPSRIGREIVVRTSTYIIDVANVTNQSGGVLTFFPKATVNLGNFGRGYFYQNDVTDVDAPNEYSYNPTTKSLNVFSTATPTVSVSIFDTLVKCEKNTVFNHVSLTGGNQLIIQIDSATTIRNSVLQYAGWDLIEGDGCGHVVIDNDSLMNAFNNHLTYDWIIRPAPPKLTVTNNYFKNVGIAAGMGKSGVGSYTAMLIFPDSALVEYNRFDSVGYNVIHFGSGVTANKIKHNYIDTFGFTKVDQGAIYSFAGGAGNEIDSNTVTGGIGNTAGITGNNIAIGIYLDDFTVGQKVFDNTITNCKWACMFIHASLNAHDTVTRNLFIDSVDRPFYIQSSSANFIGSNIFYSQNSSIDAFATDNISQTMDGNYYLRPTAPTNTINWSGIFYNASSFSSDAHGKALPTYANAVSIPLKFINPAKTNSTNTLDGTKTYIDAKGKFYNDSVTVAPYQSALLFLSDLIILSKVYIKSLQ